MTFFRYEVLFFLRLSVHHASSYKFVSNNPFVANELTLMANNVAFMANKPSFMANNSSSMANETSAHFPKPFKVEEYLLVTLSKLPLREDVCLAEGE